jgi:hypothetical protein
LKSVKVVDLLLNYKDMKLKIDVLTNEKEVLLESLLIENTFESEEDRIKSESLQAVCWDRDLIIGGVKIADEKINRIIGMAKEQHNMNKFEVNKRVGKIDINLIQLNRLLNFINSLLESLGVKDKFILYNFYVQKLSCLEISTEYSKQYSFITEKGIENRKKKSLKELQTIFDGIF